MENHDPRILPAVRHLVPPNELVGYHCDSKIAIILHSSLFSLNAWIFIKHFLAPKGSIRSQSVLGWEFPASGTLGDSNTIPFDPSYTSQIPTISQQVKRKKDT